MALKKIIVTAAYLNIPSGALLKLDDKQASARDHALKGAGFPGLYETTQATGFKRGEIFGVDGVMDKVLGRGLFQELEPAPVPEPEPQKENDFEAAAPAETPVETDTEIDAQPTGAEQAAPGELSTQDESASPAGSAAPETQPEEAETTDGSAQTEAPETTDGSAAPAAPRTRAGRSAKTN